MKMPSVSPSHACTQWMLGVSATMRGQSLVQPRLQHSSTCIAVRLAEVGPAGCSAASRWPRRGALGRRGVPTSALAFGRRDGSIASRASAGKHRVEELRVLHLRDLGLEVFDLL